MLKLNLCDYIDAYIVASETLKVAALAGGGGNNSIEVVFKNCVPFTDCIGQINNTQIDNDVVVPMYHLIEYNDNYPKTSGSLLQNYRDEPALTHAGAFDNFPGNSGSFKFKLKVRGPTGNDGIKAVKIMVNI